MLQIFSISFLLAGLPIIFSMQSLLHLNNLFVYSAMTFILLFIIDFKKILLFKLYNFNIIFLVILLILIGFLLIGLISNVNFKQIRDIVITIWITIGLITFNNYGIKQDLFLKFTFYISLISIIMTYISTPFSISYWALHGGRLFIGDTNNPNLIAWTVSLNLICIFYYLLKYKPIYYTKLFFYLIIVFDLYLFFLTQGKSSILGFALIAIFYLLRFKFKFLFNKQFLMFLNLLFIIGIIFWKKVLRFIELIHNTFVSLFYGSNMVMSADIRYENFQKSFELLSMNNLFGNGMNFFRMDSPILQIFIDLGNIFGFIVLILLVIIPLFKIKIMLHKHLSTNEEFSLIIYLFFLPNLFFHGTPYEWNTWLPVLIFYAFNNKKIFFRY